MALLLKELYEQFLFGARMRRITKHPVIEVPSDRKSVRFKFDGVEYTGYEGEMVSSALIANGIEVFSIHKKNDSPRGIFCANGQCANCTLIIDGIPQKSCVTPLKEGMVIRSLVHLPDLPEIDSAFRGGERLNLQCDILVIGGGPAGLSAAIELAKKGYNVIIVDDKDRLGGKLVLQTHKFFGSIEDCHAGTRGIDIAKILSDEIERFKNIRVLLNSVAVGIYKDRKVGVFKDNKNYILIDFEGLVIATGAREKSLLFPGNDLPGVYGAGAFQTLVNRDLVKPSSRIFIVGSGNVGLIAAYHALQAGITVVGICDVLGTVSGYKVHADKIKRMGVPIYLRHTVVCAAGDRKVEKVTVAEVDEKFRPILKTAKTFSVDTILIAVGLSPVNEFYNMAKKFGFKVVRAGDAEEIAEASSAMFGGRIAGLEMAKLMGKDVKIDGSYYEKMELLKSKPGQVYTKGKVVINESFRPIIHCVQEIPCNPCVSICPSGSIRLKKVNNNIMDIPEFAGKCTGCQLCVAICPGLAITLARKIDDENAEVILPHEFVPDFEVGDHIEVTDMDGEVLYSAEVLRIKYNRRFKTHLVTVRVPLEYADRVAGIRIQEDEEVKPDEEVCLEHVPEETVVCRCEGVTLGEILEFLKTRKVTDANQLKALRVGMGACGGKTCSTLLPHVFRIAGMEWENIEQQTHRPLNVEVPMFAIVNEKDRDEENL
ncbi:MAG: FAD-dependent oxidoreductase [Candidatus Marinimicrobia bacterium]|nr:FAD-dependent oxidoreductase [Candidatus Neomarinimicrobiota bacterium]